MGDSIVCRIEEVGKGRTSRWGRICLELEEGGKKMQSTRRDKIREGRVPNKS